MKKLGLIVLAIVMALGAIGVGYAYWTDSLTINGSVNTGSLVVGIKDNIAGAVIDPAGGGAVTQSTNVGNPIGQSVFYEAIKEEITNAYPGYATSASVTVKNLGTVPVRVGGFSFDDGNGDFDLDNIIVGAWELKKGSVVLNSGSGLPSIGDIGAALADPDAVLAAGEEATLNVAFSFDTAMDNTTMNQNADFTIKIIAKQFNDPGSYIP